MSTLKTNKVQLGQHADPLKNFTIMTPAVPDGTLEVRRGNADAPGAVVAKVLPDGTVEGVMRLKRETETSVVGKAIVDFQVPAWVNRITLLVASVSTNGTAVPLLQLGTVDGVDAASYNSLAQNSNGASGLVSVGFGLSNGTAAGDFVHGKVEFVRIFADVWACSGVVAATGANQVRTLAGTKSLAKALTSIRLTTSNGTDTFDNGVVNIMYE